LIRPVAALLLIGISPAAVAGQDRTDIAQIPSTTGAAISPAESSEPTGDAPAQLSNDEDSRSEQAQLTPVATSPQQPSQVASRSRDPQAAEPLSSPEQGRTAAIDPVTGRDKCDPAVGTEKATLQCRKIIENRAAEYRRPPPTRLSPEQKLMIDQQLRAEQDASQRLAESGDSGNNLESMGIASVVLDPQSNQDEAKKDEQDKQNQAAIQALVNVLQSTPPPQ
jgi:hypothetical protein